MIQSVKISEEAYKQMFQYVLEYANPDRPYRQWREVIGWLIGRVDGESVEVLKAIPMTSGSSIFVQMTDYSIIPKIAEEAEKINAVIVGWFHSHPSFGFFLSSVDIRTQRNQQSLFENAIALVCDPTKITSIEPGIHGYQVDMSDNRISDYRELDIHIDITDSYPNMLVSLLKELGITRSFAEVIDHKELAGLYALEGISVPELVSIKPDQLLTSELNAEPILEGEYIINKNLCYKKDCFIQIRISNIGDGIAWNVDLAFISPPNFELISMYPRRIIDQLSYDSSIIETFKIKPLVTGEIYLPRLVVYYRNSKQQRNQILIHPKKVEVLKK